MSSDAVTLVLDVGKTHSKLLAIDDSGTLLGQWQQASTSIEAPEGYRALDTAATEGWLRESLAELGTLRQRISAIVPVGHGAALAGIDERGLVLPVPDYEFTGFDQRCDNWLRRVDPFGDCFSPVLPQGLNLATQLDWLERKLPGRVARVKYWMPYPQYWAWWLSGVASCEVSSLGCHSLLWQPRRGDWSALAKRAGWAARFAPMRKAWESLGTLRPELARHFNLPADVRVLCGAHDSNACLARYLPAWSRMTLVSTGTWVVVMAPGAPLTGLDAADDCLANVSVRGDPVPTGRFMGGREYERLGADDNPGPATLDSLRLVLETGIRVLPRARSVGMGDGSEVATEELPRLLPASARGALACLHLARRTAKLVRALKAPAPVVVDGPFAANAVYLEILASLVDGIHVTSDPVDGTARGGWTLARWGGGGRVAPQVARLEPNPQLHDLLGRCVGASARNREYRDETAGTCK